MPKVSIEPVRPSRPRAAAAARWPDPPRSVLLWGVLIAALSYGAGVLASFAPYASAAAVGIGFLGAMGVAHVRRLVNRHSTPPADSRSAAVAGTSSAAWMVHDVEADVVDADLRSARLLYYGGMILIGQLTFRTPKVHLTVSDWLFFFSLCLAVSVFCLRQPRFTVKLPPLLLAGTALFVMGGLASSFGSDVPNQSIVVILRLAYLTVVWFWLGTVVLQRVEHIWLAVGVWVMSASLDGAGAILQYFKGDVIPGGAVHWGRVSGFTANINDLGGITSTALVPALLLLLFKMRGRRRAYSTLGSVTVVLIATGLILSGSVGSFLAMCVATAFWFGAHPTPVRRLLALAVVAAALLVAFSSHTPTYSQSVIDRVNHFGAGSPDDPNKTLDSRLQGYHVALVRIVKDPFVGVGLDTESSRAGTLPVHNIIIGTWFESGILGVIGIILIFLSVAREALTAIMRSKDAHERALAIALASSFVAFLVFLLSEDALYTRYGWISAGLIFAVRAVQTRRVGQQHMAALAHASVLAPAAR
jgi:O-antigen ligase